MSTLLACKQAVQRARNLGPISVNKVQDLRARGLRSAALSPTGKLLITDRRERVQYGMLTNQFDDFRGAFGRQVHLTGNLDANASQLLRAGMLVERFGAFGNCGELSAVAFRFLVGETITGKVGFVNWVGGNHEFVVAGLPTGIATNDWPYDPDECPAAWGKEAVWCDPWTGNCFDTWKKAVWEPHAKAILKKTMPSIATDDARRGTSFRLLAISSCGPRAAR